MNLGKYLTALAATCFMFFSFYTNAQMRAECGADPSKPGACFFPSEVGNSALFCEDGAIFVGPADSLTREFGRVNPNGKIAVHQTAVLSPAVACRAEDALICGEPSNPGPGLFYGDVNLQFNGFVVETGQIACPTHATLKGILFRDMGYGPEEVEIDAVLHAVKDNKTGGCKLLKCRVFAPND